MRAALLSSVFFLSACNSTKAGDAAAGGTARAPCTDDDRDTPIPMDATAPDGQVPAEARARFLGTRVSPLQWRHDGGFSEITITLEEAEGDAIWRQDKHCDGGDLRVPMTVTINIDEPYFWRSGTLTGRVTADRVHFDLETDGVGMLGFDTDRYTRLQFDGSFAGADADGPSTEGRLYGVVSYGIDNLGGWPTD